MVVQEGSSSKPCLKVDNVVKRFGGLTALDEVSFQVFQNDIVGLLGPNGSGKTTLLNVINGIYKPDSGRVFFLGRDITGESPEEICRAGLSRVFQMSKPFNRLSAIQNVEVAYFYGKDGARGDRSKRQPADYLEMFGLSNRLTTRANSLGLVERRFLEFATALASEPKLILLDEPFAGLDDAQVETFRETIGNLEKENLTMLIVEHKIQQVLKLCNRVVILGNGTKIFEGSPNDAFQDERVIQAYLGKGHAS